MIDPWPHAPPISHTHSSNNRCFKLCLPCRPRPRINGKAPPPDSALARFLMTFRGRVQAQRLAAWRAFRAAHDMPLTEEPELLRFDHEGAVVNGAPLTLKEVAETGPEEQALLVELVVSRVDESLLREGFLRAVMAARAQGRLHRPATVATMYVECFSYACMHACVVRKLARRRCLVRPLTGSVSPHPNDSRAWRRVNRLMGGDTTLGLAFAVAKALGLTPWELGEWHDSAAAEEGDGSGRARCLLSQPEEPGMTPEARCVCVFVFVCRRVCALVSKECVCICFCAVCVSVGKGKGGRS